MHLAIRNPDNDIIVTQNIESVLVVPLVYGVGNV